MPVKIYGEEPSKQKKIKSIVGKQNKSARQNSSLSSSSDRSFARSNFVENYELPQRYNTTQITLMARDPHWAHAYWEISDSAREQMRHKVGKALERSTQVLRLYDVTSIDFNGRNANQSFDIEVDPKAQNWYMNFWQSGTSYCGEIGMRTPSGEFHPYARSNAIATPPASSPGRTDMVWMAVKENEDPKSFVFLERQERISGRKHSPLKTVSAQQRHRRRKFYLSEQEVREYYASLFPLLRLLRGRLRAKKYKGLGMSPSILGEFDDYLLNGLTREEFLRRLHVGASAQLVLESAPGGASEQLFSGASETIAGKKGRKFFFEIWTELLVYGRTEPDAEVKLKDKIIKLRPDGTFSLRYALPDGKIPFDFIATSADKLEQRRIVTAVERTKTMYSP